LHHSPTIRRNPPKTAFFACLSRILHALTAFVYSPHIGHFGTVYPLLCQVLVQRSVQRRVPLAACPPVPGSMRIVLRHPCFCGLSEPRPSGSGHPPGHRTAHLHSLTVVALFCRPDRQPTVLGVTEY